MPPLDNPKRERFCQEYVIDRNGLQAAIRAKYAAGSAKVTASRLLTDVNVRARIDELQVKVTDKLEITAERVLRETARLAFSDVRKYFNDDGTLRAFSDLDDDAAAALAGFESVEKAIPGEAGMTEQVRKFKIWDKPAALGMLGKHLNLFNEKIEIGEDLAAALDRARSRRPPSRA